MNEDVYLKKDLINHLKTLLPSGFTMSNDYFYMNTANYKLVIDFGYSTYYPHCVRFNGVSLNYRFHQVEQHYANILNSLTGNTEFVINQNQQTVFIGFGRGALNEADWWEMTKTEVEDDESFLLIKPKLQELLNMALNFNNTNDTLLKIYNYIESKGSEYVHHYRKPAPAFRAILRKMHGLSYSTDLNAAITRLSQDTDQSWANFCTGTKNYLDQL
jgi:hypothetical protein